IDHGAAFYFHHSWGNWEKQALSPFPYVKDHVLLASASALDEVDRECRELLTDDVLRNIVALIPDEWLQWEQTEERPDQLREVYFKFLQRRREHSEIFLNEAKHARDAVV